MYGMSHKNLTANNILTTISTSDRNFWGQNFHSSPLDTDEHIGNTGQKWKPQNMSVASLLTEGAATKKLWFPVDMEML